MDDNRITPYPLRLDPDLRDKLQKLADRNNRKLSQEIIAILRAATNNPSTLEQINNRLAVIEKNTSK